MLRLCVTCTCLLLVSLVVQAQPRDKEAARKIALRDALNLVHFPSESATAAKRREAARKFAAAGQFPEAIEEYQRLLDEVGSKLIAVDPDEPRLCLPLRRLCHLDLSRLPAEALRLYRNRVDAQARLWLDEGISRHNVTALLRVIDEAFCSSAGDAALDLLGDLAFERGRFEEAQRWWRQIVLPATERNRPAGNDDFLLVFPDPTVDLALVRAKQILARLFEGLTGPALQTELAAFRELHASAEGLLAGRRGKYADILQQLASAPQLLQGEPEAETWTTFGGEPGRGHVLAHDPRGDGNRLLRLLRDGERRTFHLQTRERLPAATDFLDRTAYTLEVSRFLATHPILVGTQVLVANARTITGYDAVTGQATVWFDLLDALRIDPQRLALDEPPLPQADVRHTLTAADDCVLARLGAPGLPLDRPDAGSDSFLVCLDTRPGASGNRLRWFAKPDTPNRGGALFEGSPLVHEGRAYTAVTSFVQGQMLTAIHCYPLRASGSPPLRWRQEVCQTRFQKPAEGRESRSRHHLLTAAGRQVVYCSHSGAIVALDAATGTPSWSVRYPSRGPMIAPDRPSPRELAPCVYSGGHIYAAPADSERMFCLDSTTGRSLWERDRIEAVHLLGVSRGRLVFTTPGGIRALNAADGTDATGWVQPGDGTALPSFGRGVLAGDVVIWPTRDALHVLDVRDGQPPDNLIPGPLQMIPRGNLVLGDGILAIAGREELTIFTSATLLRAERERRARAEPQSAVARYLAAVSREDFTELKQVEQLPDADVYLHGERMRDLARARRWETLMEQGRSDEAASEEFTTTQRVKALAARGDWRVVLDDPLLRREGVIDRQGNPQSAAVLATTNLYGRPAARPPRAYHELQATVPVPLLTDWHEQLEPGERLLPVQTAAATELLFAQGEQVVCRDLASGKRRWACAVPLASTWAGVNGESAFVGGPRGLACLGRFDGRLRWHLPADAVGALGGFRLAGDRVCCTQAGRRLLAVDSTSGLVLWHRWAPSGRLGLVPPGGRFHERTLAGADRLIVQTTSGRLWVLDAVTGRMLHDLETTREPWPQSPLALDDRHVAVATVQGVTVLDTLAGRQVWARAAGSPTTRTGQPPFVVGDGRLLILLVPRNHGTSALALDPLTGDPRWPAERLLSRHLLSAEVTAFEQDVLWFHAGGDLSCVTANDGSVAWSVPLPAPAGPWRVRPRRECLVAWPADAGAVSVAGGWLSAAAGFDAAFPIQRRLDEGLPVLMLDARTGQLVQRVNLPVPAPTTSAPNSGVRTLPQLEVARLRPTVQLGAGGLAVVLGRHVWGRGGLPSR